MKILKFSAIWCPSCIIMTNTINKLVKKYPNIEIINYDYDSEDELVSKYNIGDILPVLIFINDNGDEITRTIGEKSLKELEEVVRENNYEKNN